jgi:hypothetical protein
LTQRGVFDVAVGVGRGRTVTRSVSVVWQLPVPTVYVKTIGLCATIAAVGVNVLPPVTPVPDHVPPAGVPDVRTVAPAFEHTLRPLPAFAGVLDITRTKAVSVCWQPVVGAVYVTVMT